MSRPTTSCPRYASSWVTSSSSVSHHAVCLLLFLLLAPLTKATFLVTSQCPYTHSAWRAYTCVFLLFKGQPTSCFLQESSLCSITTHSPAKLERNLAPLQITPPPPPLSFSFSFMEYIPVFLSSMLTGPYWAPFTFGLHDEGIKDYVGHVVQCLQNKCGP